MNIQIVFIYKLGEAEREILTLAPHFESKLLPETFDGKIDRLNTAATQDITWLHLLSTTTLLIRNSFLIPFCSRLLRLPKFCC